MNKDHKVCWISPNIIWSLIYQMKHLPVDIGKIIFYFAYRMEPELKKDLLNATVQKKFDLWRNTAVSYCVKCGEYQMPPILSGEHRNYCRC